MKASFTVEWLALPQKEVPHILDKINLLTEDPTPDAKTKKQVMQQPEFLVPNGSDDLLRIKEGELIPFLLKLLPDQEQYVTWSIQANGPTLLKGGPGTGKSMIALYRVRALLQELHKRKQEQIQILFTTYTNALVKSSEQLLEQLLGPEIRFVEVQTAMNIWWNAILRVSKAVPCPWLLCMCNAMTIGWDWCACSPSPCVS